MSSEFRYDYAIQKILLLSFSPAWQTRIRNLTFPAPLIHTLSFADLLSESSRWPGNLALVELPSEMTPKWTEQILESANQPQTPVMIGLGNHNWHQRRRELSLLGFAHVIYPTEAGKLSALVERHYRTAKIPDRSLESYVESNLPWPQNGE